MEAIARDPVAQFGFYVERRLVDPAIRQDLTYEQHKRLRMWDYFMHRLGIVIEGFKVSASQNPLMATQEQEGCLECNHLGNRHRMQSGEPGWSGYQKAGCNVADCQCKGYK